MKVGLGRFLSRLKSYNAFNFSVLQRMCPELPLSRGSKIMALLDWFPEIHLRLSMHYCPMVRSRPRRLFTVNFSTLLTGKSIRNCLYLN